MKTHDEHGNMIDDAAVSTFVTSIDSLPNDEWRARTLAFESLIESLPRENEPPPFLNNGGITPWYKSHTALRRLFKPLSELLLDARSTVAKHTCQHLAFLVRRVKVLNPPYADTCKYLLKDLLPSVLSLHAQTVKVIRGYALEMMTIVIPLCRFKSGLPVMLERLRKDKSRDVREACIKYLRLIVRHWAKEIGPPIVVGGSAAGGSSAMSGMGEEEQQKRAEYLTPSICLHIGNGLARALMDPSQSVRLEARNAFEIFRYKYPDIWNQIVQKKDGILSKDKRLKKSIMNAAIKADAEGRSDLSNYYPAYEEGEDYDGKSIHSNESSKGSWHSRDSFTSRTSRISTSNKSKGGFRDANPKTKRNTSRQRPRTGGSGTVVPKRTGAGLAGSGNNGKNLPPHSRNGRAPGSGGSRSAATAGTGTASKKTITTPRSSGLASRSMDSNSNNNIESSSVPHNNSSSSTSPVISEVEIKDIPSEYSDLAKDMRGAPNAYGTEITHSTSSVSDQSNNNSSNSHGNGSGSGGPKPDENYQVANQLLSAHKTYIDELMESLRTEMNTVREFEALLVNSKSSMTAEGSYGPKEDEVLKYFETVYGFLERGTENGTKLREAMERVSRTEFQF